MADADGWRQVVRMFREEEIPFKAASVAFYAVVSFVPLLIVAVAALSAVGAEDDLVALLRSSLSESGVDVLNSALRSTRGRGVAGVIGLLVTLWSATKVFRALSIAFAEIYRETPEHSLLDEAKRSLIVLGLLLFAFVLLGATGAVLAYVPSRIPYQSLVSNVAAILVLVFGLLPLYYILPPVSVSVRHALPGAILAAIGWVALQFGFTFYAQRAASYAAYGFLGAVLLFVTFLYFAAIVLLVGAAMNVAWERPRRDDGQGETTSR